MERKACLRSVRNQQPIKAEQNFSNLSTKQEEKKQLTKAFLPKTTAMSTEQGHRAHGADVFGNPELHTRRNMSRSHCPAGRASECWNPHAPVGMWYKEQLLAKLVELNHPDINALKTSCIPKLHKALKDMGFDQFLHMGGIPHGTNLKK